MALIPNKQRYNWMGFNGTETDEIDTDILRGENAPLDNYNYDHRQQVVAELKERLYQIKRDLDLLPDEELRSEEEKRRRRKEARLRREAEERQRKQEEESRRAEEAERVRLEREFLSAERRRSLEEEDERHRIEEEEAQRNADRWRKLHEDSDADSDVEEEQNIALSTMGRTQNEIDVAVRGFSNGARMVLLQRGQGYVSYLDGSIHSSMHELEAYNARTRIRIESAVHGGETVVPKAANFSLEHVDRATQRYKECRLKLEAYRVMQDPSYAARIPSTEKDGYGNPNTEVQAIDGDDVRMEARLADAKQQMEEIRVEYNTRASESGKGLASLALMLWQKEGSVPRSSARSSRGRSSPARSPAEKAIKSPSEKAVTPHTQGTAAEDEEKIMSASVHTEPQQDDAVKSPSEL